MNTKTFEQKVKDAIDGEIIIGDGHTLFGADFYAPHFTASELADAGLLRNHASNQESWKSTIFSDNGEVIDELFAVYNLEFLYWIANQIGVTESVRSMGRGSQARELVGYIREKLA